MTLTAEARFVLTVLPEAARMLHEFEQRREPIRQETKDRGELVTVADRAINSLLVDAVHSAFAHDAICAEEGSGHDNPGAQRRWFIDPLDGTRSFVAGRPGYSIMLGLVVEGTPTLGVVYDACARRTLIAQRSSGVFEFNDNRLCELRGSASQRRLMWNPFTRPDAAKPLSRALGLAGFDLCESVGLRACAMARGEAMVFGSGPCSPKLWDSAAAAVFVAELGGQYTDFDLRPLDYRRAEVIHERGAVASVGLNHETVVRAVREALETVRA
ncbi:MAG: inositol monophosphatase family protein [Planctomycetes bacterium]|nr:inositol monophosphatase family protein [Planctomycetota bacterium]